MLFFFGRGGLAGTEAGKGKGTRIQYKWEKVGESSRLAASALGNRECA